jgi:hypothetical protein
MDKSAQPISERTLHPSDSALAASSFASEREASMDFTQHIATRLQRLLTPQREPIPDTDQVPNSAGGYVWPVNDWVRLDRFLVLGTEGGTYYIGEKQLTIANAEAVTRCVAADGPRVVARIVEVSEAGRAPTNDPALFALALAAGRQWWLRRVQTEPCGSGSRPLAV